jgi:carbonic anhydrase
MKTARMSFAAIRRTSRRALPVTGIEANVGWAVHQLASTPVGSDAIARGAIQLVGPVYELDTGRLRFL